MATELLEGARASTCPNDGCADFNQRVARGWLSIGVAAVFAGQGMVFSLAVNMTPPTYGSGAYWAVHGILALSAVLVAAFIGRPLFRATWLMVRRRALTIEGLFTLSMAGAFAGSLFASITGEGAVYYEVVAVVLLVYTVGKLMGERSRGRLLVETERLRERFDTAMVVLEGGALEQMAVAHVLPGSLVEVAPGAAVSVDGVIESGLGFVEETPLTGEPLPVVKRPGERLRAGTWVREGRYRVRVDRGPQERELDHILASVENAPEQVSELQGYADRLMGIFLPLVAGVSFSAGVVWWFLDGWSTAMLNSMAVLLISCPCALGLATPVAVWQALYRLGSLGLLSRSGDLVDVLAKTKRIFLDKTGTLSEGKLTLRDMVWRSTESEEVAACRQAVYAVERAQAHPIAAAVVTRLEAEGVSDEGTEILAMNTVSGSGVEAEVRLPGGRSWKIRMGDLGFVAEPWAQEEWRKLEASVFAPEGRRVYVARKGAPMGILVFGEVFRSGVEALSEAFTALGIEAVVLTGDAQPELAKLKGFRVEAGLSAEDKVRHVMASVRAGEAPLFVGDGLNDAAAMSVAQSSIAMESGVAITRSAAAGRLAGDRIDLLPEAIRLCRETRQRIFGNLRYARWYNFFGIGLAAFGLLHPVVAALIMVCSSFFVTARALRRI